MTLDDFPPMLLDERPLALDEPGWLYEIQFDGYRVTAMFGKCTLRTRNGARATTWFPEIGQSLAKAPGGPHVTDGEVCFLDDLGRSDFEQLQERPSGASGLKACSSMAQIVKGCPIPALDCYSVVDNLGYKSPPLQSN
ncbi:hypothetical protein QTI66_36650 [Variovorax sp. J22R133]|uniref:hypothetical protein n=1 Tax=Variovorax brevis TaxID=3053503 RepID=UPI0025771FD1|nr:hypothetical protein [Variovorax sp. J22R133]MDM0117639.1 hypothetical protein [Variovorax sp. J22R133]